MKTTRNWMGRVGSTLVLTIAMVAPAAVVAQEEFTGDFGIERCKFDPNGRHNPYFSLNPGDQLTLEGEDDGEEVRVEITVENATKKITFRTPGGRTMTVQARVVVEREWVDDEIVEISRNWFSRCKQTHDIFYFGEAVDNFEDGELVDHDGSWEAGVAGAQPGILIPARFLLGSRYFQEQAPGVALDRAEHVDMGLSLKAAGRTFHGCVAVSETSPLDAPGSQSLKVYCPGVGLVMDDDIVLTEFERSRN